MYKLNKRILSALMALLLVVSLLSGLTLTASAATVDYQYGSTNSDYSQYSNIVKNWGTREELATFLSPMAEDFYADDAYEELVALNGASDVKVVNTSALYVALYQLMSSSHTTKNSYGESRDLFQFTDCQNNGTTTTKISAFYSAGAIGPAWDSGATWNREHVWPNSKGGDSDVNASTRNNEADIIMLRPETTNNNSSRGNKAFGEAAAYYNPEDEFVDEYDVRGDIARIVLYTYVRWGTEQSAVLDNMWGSSGVIESKEVLLDWMEADPVDTWEMGRNDSVQSITGTRNVFVDYPELAFALFNEEIPEMSTPSGHAGTSEQITYTVEFFQNGVRQSSEQVQNGYKCALPAFKGTVPTGYSFEGWTTTQIENSNQKPALIAAGTEAVIKADAKYYAVLSTFDTEAEGQNVWTLVTDDSQIKKGDEVVIAARDYDFAMSTTQAADNRKHTVVSKTDNTLICDSTVAVLTLETGVTSGTYAFYTGSGYLSAINNSGNYLRTSSTLNNAASFYISPSSDGTCAITSAAYISSTSGVGNVPMQYNPSGMFSCYPKATQKPLSLYVGQHVSGGYTYTTTWESAACAHTNTTTATVEATCTTDGSETVTCDDCGEIISTSVLPAGHTEEQLVVAPTLTQEGYSVLVCSVCKEELEDREDYTAPLTDVQSWNLTLEDNISVNFKINVDDSIASTAKVHIAVGSDAKVYDIGSLVANDDGTYIVSTKVAAARMTEAITVKITNGTDTTEEKTYSIKTYAQTILDGNYPETTKNLVKAMLHYGAAAQNYFNYKTNDLANAGVGAVTSAAPATANIFKTVGSADGVEFYGATLVFRDRIALRYYFTVTGDISQYTFTVSGKEVTPVHKGNQYYVEIADINPQDLDTAFTVKVNDTLSVTYSPMNYVVNMHKKGTEDLQALMQALCDYHTAAVAYLAEK